MRSEKILPLRVSALRPLRIDFIRAIAHANDARFARRAGARVRRAVGIQQQHPLPPPRQVPGCPRAENARTDDRNVEILRHLPSNARPIGSAHGDK